MRVYKRNKFDIIHSLTPKPSISPTRPEQYSIPTIPEGRKMSHAEFLNHQLNTTQRSRKHRLIDQRNTSIQKSNRMLYEKIRKIMQKGRSEKKVEILPEESQSDDARTQFLNTSIKPLSLPQVSSSMRSTKSELNSILDNRNKFAQKYFADLEASREHVRNLHSEEVADLVCFGWRVKVLLLDHGKYVLLRGKKGKKQRTKKYIQWKVREKMEGDLQGWASSKFEFQI